MAGIASLVGTPHIMRKCWSFSSDMALTPMDVGATECDIDVAAMPNVATWTVTVTMVEILIGG